jgi:hypothetical protein
MRKLTARLGVVLIFGLLAACSGGGGGTPSPVPPSITSQPQSVTVNQGQNAAFSVSATGTAPLSYQWRKGGSALAGASAASLTLAAVQPGDAGSYDVVVSNSAGTAASSAAILTVNVPPSITLQPQNQTVLAPAQATFNVSAAGTPPLAYQWKKNGTDLPGATSSSYSTPPTTGSDDGAVFSVTVSNAAGSLPSASATLTVHLAAAITTQPLPQSVVAPEPATFVAAAAGTPPLSYQWRKNGVALAGANAASYTTPPTGGADHGAAFSVVVSNAFGSATSSNATLTVNLPPAITAQPLGQSVVAPAAATFSATATGTAPLSYQWKKNGVDVAGATASTYTTLATTIGDNGSVFTVFVSSPFGGILSQGATLTVTAAPQAPTITIQPTGQTVTAPAPATFSVTAAGSQPLAYQWKKNGVNLGGATSSSYTTPATTLSDQGALFTVTVSNSAGSVTSDAAALTVNSAPVITVHPANQTVAAPATASFGVTATGTAPLSYQWKKGGVDIGGATASTYTTPATTLSDSGSVFSVRVSNAFGSVLSGNAALTVNAPAALDLSVPTVYITQATQTPAFDVPLVKDRNGYLRAFVVANQANTAVPRVRARIYDGVGTLKQTYTIPAPGASVPTSVNESSLSNSWNVAIPGTYLQPGYQLLVDVDDNNAVAESNESNNTWPAGGTPQALTMKSLQPFHLTFVPVTTTTGTGNVDAGNMASFASDTLKLHPIPSLDLALRASAMDSSTKTLQSDDANGHWGDVLDDLTALRNSDPGGTGRYYFGVVKVSYTSGNAGLGWIPGSAASTSYRAAIGWDYLPSGNSVTAHELGHNLGRRHAPGCGAANPDPGWPGTSNYAGGLIGVWGLDVASGMLKNPATQYDHMSYCSPEWVSDYGYKKIITFREASPIGLPPPPDVDAPATRSVPRSLLVWGSLADGQAQLHPAFHIDAEPQPPEPGDHLLTGYDAAGAKVFEVSFDPVPMADATRLRWGINFTVPLSTQDAARLTELRWTKAGETLARQGGDAVARIRPTIPSQEPMLQVLPEARTRLLWDAGAHPMVLVKDRATGRGLGIGRNGDFSFHTEAEELELHFSDGVSSRPVVVRRPRPGE